MINSEDCYVIVDEDKQLAYPDLVFDGGVKEAEEFLEEEGVDEDELDIISLSDYLSDI